MKRIEGGSGGSRSRQHRHHLSRQSTPTPSATPPSMPSTRVEDADRSSRERASRRHHRERARRFGCARRANKRRDVPQGRRRWWRPLSPSRFARIYSATRSIWVAIVQSAPKPSNTISRRPNRDRFWRRERCNTGDRVDSFAPLPAECPPFSKRAWSSSSRRPSRMKAGVRCMVKCRNGKRCSAPACPAVSHPCRTIEFDVFVARASAPSGTSLSICRFHRCLRTGRLMEPGSEDRPFELALEHFPSTALGLPFLGLLLARADTVRVRRSDVP